MTIRYLSRAEIRQVTCPQCQAAIGDPCVSPGGYIRRSNHAKRVDEAARLLSVTLPHKSGKP